MSRHSEYRLKKLAENPNYDHDRYTKHAVQKSAYSARYAKADPRRRKNAQLKTRYGLSLEDYERMAEIQQHKCAICTRTFDNTKRATRAVVDHDHVTGKVRKLLCNNCNSLLGYSNDKIEILQEAIKYLQESQVGQ